MKWIYVVASAALLFGCNSIPRQAAAPDQSAEIEAALSAAVAQCREDWIASRGLDPIREKIPSFIMAATLPQLGDRSMVSGEQKPAVEEMDRLRLACESKIAGIYDAVWPADRLTLMRKHIADGRALRSKLWSGELSFGAYISAAQIETSAYFAEDGRMASAQQRESEARAIEQQKARAARMAAMAQYMQATKPPPAAVAPIVIQQPAYQAPRQTNTTCSKVPFTNQIQCTSY